MRSVDVYINGKKIRLTPKQTIAKGGEAEIFDLGAGKALKLFKQPQHPDYQASPQEQQAARDRLLDHQQKLRQFPPTLPQRVIQPEALVTDKSGQTVLGYTMPLVQGAEVLLRYSDRAFRQSGIPHQTVVQIFQDLHTTVSQLHQAGVAIGDFNDLNVLVRGTEAYLVDADSFQFGTFLCKVFTLRFVDPLLCDPQQPKPLLKQPHSPNSDWYAFAVMLMQCLLFVNPYGGVYKPKNPALKIPQDARSLHRITVFHPEVQYPKPALPYQVLPDALLHQFHQIFEQDYRGEFPRRLLDSLQWTQCRTCGIAHARNACPTCISPAGIAAGIVAKVTTLPIAIRGTVTATPIFATGGVILYAALQAGRLNWLYHDCGAFKRRDERGDGASVLTGNLDPYLRFRFHGQGTAIVRQGQAITLEAGQVVDRLAIDCIGTLPLFETNDSAPYWIHNGQLLRDSELGAVYMGDVLSNQTRFWVGSHFGFGFYPVGHGTIAFVFDAKQPGINDHVTLPLWTGQLIEAGCSFSSDRCWFFLATQEQGKTIHRCTVVRSDGSIVATAQAEAGEGSWLSTLQGKCAAGHFLLAATDEGIVRVEVQQGQLVKTKEFPDTEPFVDASCQLFAAPDGLYVVGHRTIQRLTIV